MLCGGLHDFLAACLPFVIVRFGGSMLPANCLTVFPGIHFHIALFFALFRLWYLGLGC